MSNVLYYYAVLNEDNVCIGFEISTKRGRGNSKLILLPEENTSYLYTKYDHGLKAFSQEKYEPSIGSELQDRVNIMEDTITSRNETIAYLQNENIELRKELDTVAKALEELMFEVVPNL